MAGKWFYLTIMKGRKAEYGALIDIDQETSDRVTPLISLWPGESSNDDPTTQMWPDAGGDKAARGLVADLLSRAKGRWPDDRPVILDGDWLGPDAYSQVLDAVRGTGTHPLPVTGLGRSDAYQAVVAQSLITDSQGSVLRLERTDLTEGLADHIDEWMTGLGLAPEQVDVIIDLREIERRYLERDAILASNVLRSLPHLHDWRNLALAGSSVPKVVDKDTFPLDDGTSYPRLEWWLWQMVRDRTRSLGRVPTFGDYGAIHPERVEESRVPQSLPRIPSIRYAGENDVLLLRGEDLDNDATDPDRFRRLLNDKLIADSERWPGNNDSWAERWIVSVARGGASLGNHRIWHKVWTVRHLTFVSRQLAR